VPDTLNAIDGQPHYIAANATVAEQNALIASIEAARRELKFALVEERAAALRQQFPDLRAGYRTGAEALRELGRLDEAAALLQDAGTRFFGEPWLLVELATLAARRGDWQEATEWAAALRRDFPAIPDGYRLELGRLRRLNRFDDAAALLAAAEKPCAGEDWLLIEAALLAEARGDHDTAAAVWRRHREAAPASRAGYVGGIRSSLAAGRVGMAAAIAAEAEPRFGGTPWLTLQAARIADLKGDLREAERRWAAARRAAPADEATWQGHLDVLTRAGRWDEAEVVLEMACVTFPIARWALMGRANLASARRTSAEIDTCWARAVAVFPNDPEIALRHAMAPTTGPKQTRDARVALSRLRDVHERFPNFVPAWRTFIKTLRAAESRPEAAQVARACVQRFPDDPDLWLELAASLDADEEIADQLTTAAERFPTHDAIRLQLARALARCGRLDAAEIHFQHLLTRMPNYYDLACDHAELAMRRKDWPEALRRWQAVRERFPKDRRSEFGFLDTTTALSEAGLEAAAAAPPDVADADADAHANIYARFQSLGGTGLGCEFGLVQRANGAHPVNLMRWTQIHPQNLTDALTHRFSGVGTREQTVIGLSVAEDPDNPEYIYQDDRFKMAMHTFVHKRDLPEDEMFTQTCRRTAYLRRQLLEDLEDGEQIFVYKFHRRNLTADELGNLHRAVRSYGDTALLYVRYADANHPSGTVEQADTGLYVGYISGFNVSPENEARQIDLPAWDRICRGALSLHLAAQARTRPETA
jgi:tetratricopeptide (TPR) repeat protein